MKPRIIIYSVPEETTADNVTATIKAQNPEIITNDETIEAKFRFQNKRGQYNIVMEVGPQTCRKILQHKIRIGWNICKAVNYLTPIRCLNVVNLTTNTMNAKARKPAHTAPDYTK